MNADTSPAPTWQPLWQQIRALIVRDLESSAWKPGEAIPSELELAARFRVSQGTVRRAIDALADENLLVRRQGKGTFVATHTEEKVSGPRFLRIRRDDGIDEYPASRLILFQRQKPAATHVTQRADRALSSVRCGSGGRRCGTGRAAARPGARHR